MTRTATLAMSWAADFSCWQYLVQYFLQVGGSHAISHVSVGWVGEKELSLCSQCLLNVLLAINVLLTSVDYTNVTCKSGVRDQMVARMRMSTGLKTISYQLAALQKRNSSGNTL